MKNKAIDLLNITRKAPQMFCSNKEALLSRVTTILEMVDINFNVIEFYKKHLTLTGNSLLGTKDNYPTEWGHKVIDDALEIIKNN